MPDIYLSSWSTLSYAKTLCKYTPWHTEVPCQFCHDSDYSSCGGIGTVLHYATECIYTVSWYMRKPVPNFEQEWLKRVANNLVSRHTIRRIVKFISENRDLFRPP
ncbi:hypothetical protein AVEN_12970-1 [Araneus ventricosus]|uniref:Uncharacterized protein n=1 Tax=Araneus ventricosus TaxID=182803 RepID=A0A4Y2L7Z5_ARAVE|nr:hypothetical protein AVEN_12970-1 [Araneus ventricosus]